MPTTEELLPRTIWGAPAARICSRAKRAWLGLMGNETRVFDDRWLRSELEHGGFHREAAQAQLDFPGIVAITRASSRTRSDVRPSRRKMRCKLVTWDAPSELDSMTGHTQLPLLP
jgi:hypothetical protein